MTPPAPTADVVVGAGYASPEPPSTARRLHLFTLGNLVAIWVSVLGLVVLDRAIGGSEALRGDLLVLVPGGLAYLAAFRLTRAGRHQAAAVTSVLTTWAVGFGITWFTPVITPLGPLVMHAPVLVLTDVFSLRTRTRVLAATVLLTGAVVVLGESRRPVWEATEQQVPVPALLTGIVTMLVAGVLVLGLRDHVLRLARRSEALELSRARVASAAVEARRSIERDLHDGAQQRLATIAVDIGRASRALDSDPARARDLLAGLQGQVQEAIRELRDLAHGIYPAGLREWGLGGALPAAGRRTSLPCVVDVSLTHRHDAEVEAAVYFCCLEAMQNADRHSGGERIAVRVTDDDGDSGAALCFSVEDDGPGFAVEEHRDDHGLAGMRDRVQSAGGRLEVVSGPEGTRVLGRFPTGTARIPVGGRAGTTSC